MESMNLFGENNAKDGLVHYQGIIGDFWYNPKEFIIKNSDAAVPISVTAEFFERIKDPYGMNRLSYPYLQYVGTGNSASLPKGCISTYHMFSNCILPEGFKLIDFDTSSVKDMRYMFKECEFPKGFALGDKFDTSNVTDMSAMFLNCKMSEDFSLGDKFDTSKVIDMRNMFDRCKFPEGFTLGHRFDTSNVIRMEYMFCGCKFPKGFSLGHKFDTSNVIGMDYMFCCCKFPHGFSFGNNFDTRHVEGFKRMFDSCVFPEGFSLGNKFSVANGYLRPCPNDPALASHIIVTAEFMFDHSTIPDDFDLGESFKAEFFTTKRKDMFSNCILPDGAKQSQFRTDSAIIKWLKARHLDKINQKQNQ